MTEQKIAHPTPDADRIVEIRELIAKGYDMCNHVGKDLLAHIGTTESELKEWRDCGVPTPELAKEWIEWAIEAQVGEPDDE